MLYNMRNNIFELICRVAVTRSKDVALFGPPIPKGATFPKSKSFAEFLLAKGMIKMKIDHHFGKCSIILNTITVFISLSRT